MHIRKKEETIAEDAKIAKSLLSRIKGLMFCRKLKKGEALLLVNKSENINESRIHTFFVFFKIDAVWLDSSRMVVDKKESIMPFTPLIKPGKPARYILELPAKASRLIKIGDVLEFTKDI